MLAMTPPQVDFPGELRRCCSCKTVKPYSQFYRTERRGNDTKSGYYRSCMACCKEKSLARFAKRKLAPTVQVESKYCAACQHTKHHSLFTTNRTTRDWLSRFCIPCEQRARDSDVDLPEYLVRLRRWRRYKMTTEEFEALFAKQGGVCAICRKILNPAASRKGEKVSDRPVIDHCHTTGKVRGILCHGCNMWLAKVEHPNWIERALAYLRAFEQSNI